MDGVCPSAALLPISSEIGDLGERAVGNGSGLGVNKGSGPEPLPQLPRVGQDAEEVDEGDEGEDTGDEDQVHTSGPSLSQSPYRPFLSDFYMPRKAVICQVIHYEYIAMKKKVLHRVSSTWGGPVSCTSRYILRRLSMKT